MINVTPTRLSPLVATLLTALVILAVTTPIHGQALSTEDDQTILSQLNLARYDVQELTIPEWPVSSFTISFSLDGEIVELELAPHSVRSDGFRVRTRDARGNTQLYPLPAPTTYRGRIRQKAGSIAAASIINGQLRARIVDGDSVLVIQPMDEVLPKAGRDQYVLFYRTDVIALDYKCGTDLLPPHDQAAVGQKSFFGGNGCENIAEIAFDTDVEFFVLNGNSVPATVADIESIVNGMNVIYERDVLITHTISEIIVQIAEPDLLDSSDSGDLLNEFRALWNTNHSPGSSDPIDRDIAHLMTGKDLIGNIIGVAWVGQICADLTTGIGYGLSQSRWTANFDNRVAITAHELGHNWNALHCNGDADCAIMCANIGACSGINDQFGATSIADISSYRDSLLCLDSLPPPVGPDCNINCIEDAIDISTGSSQDCNSNSIPDECDFTSGLENDCNFNGIPDSCEDCDGNGIADSCEFAGTFNETSGELSPIGLGFPVSHTFITPPDAQGDVTLQFAAIADLASTQLSLDVYLNDDFLEQIFRNTGSRCPATPDEDQLVVSQAVFNDSLLNNFGDAVIRIETGDSVEFDACGGSSWVSVTLDYSFAPDIPDVNGNGVPDSCDLARGDFNLDGVVSVTDLLSMLAAWGLCPGCDEDTNDDGVVNVIDLLHILANWG